MQVRAAALLFIDRVEILVEFDTELRNLVEFRIVLDKGVLDVSHAVLEIPAHEHGRTKLRVRRQVREGLDDGLTA